MPGRSAGTNIDDATITASVKSKLVSEKMSNLTRVNVDTNDGTVYPYRHRRDRRPADARRAAAREAKGVKIVINNLQVQKK